VDEVTLAGEYEMPMPMSLLSIFGRKHFWNDYLFQDDSGGDYPELDQCRIPFDLSTRYGLVLGLDDLLCQSILSLRHPDAGHPVQIAWDDQAHWHPHVLRWDELDVIAVAWRLESPASLIQDCPFFSSNVSHP